MPRSTGFWMRFGFRVIGGALIIVGSFVTTLFVIDYATKWKLPPAQFVYNIDGENKPTLNPPFNIPNAAIDQSFAFRMRLVPAEQQVDYAAPLSSHTGDNNSGFAILHKPDVRDGYMAVAGNGKAFWFSEPFTVPHGRESELIVSYNNGHLLIWVNRTAVIDKTGLGPIALAAVPVTIGDWHLGGRKFSGVIREVDFFSDALPGT